MPLISCHALPSVGRGYHWPVRRRSALQDWDWDSPCERQATTLPGPSLQNL
jgi:hypothetical protein